jgi:hypothetical protein
MSSYRQGLIDEIRFWQELISESCLRADSPGYERMKNALQFAQQKLSRHEHFLDFPVGEVIKH